MKRVQIAGWPEYEIQEDGAVFRVAPGMGATIGKQVKQQQLKNSYMKVSLCRNSKRKEYLVHRLVYQSFVDDIPPKMDICHNDGNRSNNELSNLRCDTRKGNMADTIKHGTSNRGERCGSNKYPQGLIKQLKERLLKGEPPPLLSKESGVPLHTLYNLRSGKIWGWL